MPPPLAWGAYTGWFSAGPPGEDGPADVSDGERGRLRGQCLDLVGPEARPVVAVGEDDGRLLVAERLDGLERLEVGGDVDDVVRQAVLVQRAVGRVALDAGRLAEDGDAHRSGSPLVALTRLDSGITTVV